MINTVAADRRLEELTEDGEIEDWWTEGENYEVTYHVVENGEKTEYSEDEMHDYLSNKVGDWGNPYRHWQ